jgi:hypothetical protein
VASVPLDAHDRMFESRLNPLDSWGRAGFGDSPFPFNPPPVPYGQENWTPDDTIYRALLQRPRRSSAAHDIGRLARAVVTAVTPRTNEPEGIPQPQSPSEYVIETLKSVDPRTASGLGNLAAMFVPGPGGKGGKFVGKLTPEQKYLLRQLRNMKGGEKPTGLRDPQTGEHIPWSELSEEDIPREIADHIQARFRGPYEPFAPMGEDLPIAQQPLPLAHHPLPPRRVEQIQRYMNDPRLIEHVPQEVVDTYKLLKLFGYSAGHPIDRLIESANLDKPYEKQHDFNPEFEKQHVFDPLQSAIEETTSKLGLSQDEPPQWVFPHPARSLWEQEASQPLNLSFGEVRKNVRELKHGEMTELPGASVVRRSSDLSGPIWQVRDDRGYTEVFHDPDAAARHAWKADEPSRGEYADPRFIRKQAEEDLGEFGQVEHENLARVIASIKRRGTAQTLENAAVNLPKMVSPADRKYAQLASDHLRTRIANKDFWEAAHYANNLRHSPAFQGAEEYLLALRAHLVALARLSGMKGPGAN